MTPSITEVDENQFDQQVLQGRVLMALLVGHGQRPMQGRAASPQLPATSAVCCFIYAVAVILSHTYPNMVGIVIFNTYIGNI